ncbi:hypothetical protein AMTR_s00016p00248600 [Amborella trichopoda]|uniref:Uncharacterized protein n=1 Tax=Amborella trichopoda TaxID=13333 RepID=W1PFF6_AMBTC|nr:hypothetical protein AMTR_s00016p00248600 [Amborella trichopoda]
MLPREHRYMVSIVAMMLVVAAGKIEGNTHVVERVGLPLMSFAKTHLHMCGLTRTITQKIYIGLQPTKCGRGIRVVCGRKLSRISSIQAMKTFQKCILEGKGKNEY